jgi:hypothetical protein
LQCEENLLEGGRFCFSTDLASADSDAWVDREDFVDGMENAPEAFIGMLEGRNFGKLIVRVGAHRRPKGETHMKIPQSVRELLPWWQWRHWPCDGQAGLQ